MTAGVEALHSPIRSSPEDMAHATSKVDRRSPTTVLSYEKIALLLSRYLLGEDHWHVVEALVKIGRVMEYTYP
jgi:hypothetical protein